MTSATRLRPRNDAPRKPQHSANSPQGGARRRDTYQLWQHFQETHQPAIQLFHPVQIRVIDALTEAVGITHQRGHTAIPIPERIRTITDYNAWLLSDEYHDLRRQAGWRPREQPGTRQR